MGKDFSYLISLCSTAVSVMDAAEEMAWVSEVGVCVLGTSLNVHSQKHNQINNP